MIKRRAKKGDNKEKTYNAFEIFRKSVKYCEGYRLIIVSCIICCAIAAAVGVVIPIVASRIILQITDGLMTQVLYSAFVVMLIHFADAAMRYMRERSLDKLKVGMLFGLQQALVREMLKMEAAEIDKMGTGKIIERLTSDIDKVASIYQDYAFWIAYVVTNAGVLFAVLVLSKEMFYLSLVIAVACFVVSRMRIKRLTNTRKILRASRDERTGMVTEIVRGFRDVKTLNAGEAIARGVGRKVRETSDQEYGIYATNRRFRFLELVVYNSSEFVYLAFGCFLFSQNLLTIPAFIIVYNYLDRIRDLFYGLTQIIDDNEQISISGNRIFEIIENNVYRKEHFGSTKTDHLDGDIVFRDVKFSFGKKQIIKGLSLHIKANQKVAIVGKSGAGKTTIMSLLTRIYDADEGDILIDGIPIRELDRDSLRGNISVVTQQPYVFNYSVKDNLRLVKPDAKMSEMREACRLARIDDYIMSLPNKYSTILGEGGVILSGGQKQRIAIARALLMKAKIILFDEATSALDNKTQSEIQEAINNLKGDYTLVIVAHRLSTIIDSDKIFVIEDGALVDSGTHRELLERCSTYKSLYNKDGKEIGV
jgi:ABC-type multidrug transport system fused ATPase/permease subunit